VNRLLRVRRVLWGAAFVGLTSAASAAAPSAQRGNLATTVYGGAGDTKVPSNEVEDIYDERHFGLGVLASFPASQAGTEAPESRGFIWQLGLTAERRSLRVVLCGYDCQSHPPTSGFVSEGDLGVRAGAGADWSVFGFRAGLLFAGGIHARVAESLPFPDVALRLGTRELLFVTLGLGAYDASTSLRPGLYAGLSVAPTKGFVGSIHYGLHFNNGSTGRTVIDLGTRLDFALDYALSPKLSAGLGIALLPTGQAQSVTEGRATIGVGF